MLAFLRDTLRRTLRSPGPYVIVGVGVLVGWTALGLSILALGRDTATSAPLLLATGQLVAAVGVLWTLGRRLQEDRSSGFTRAADCTAPGVRGRAAGRWGGAVLLGTGLGFAVVGLLLPLAPATPSPSLLLLYSASIGVAGLLVASWGIVLDRIGAGPALLLLGLVVWVAGHLPWGSPDLVPGVAGRLVGALLPRPPAPDTTPSGWLAAVAAAGGLLALALARPRRGPGP